MNTGTPWTAGELPPPAWRIELAGGHATIGVLDLTVRSLQLTAEAYQAITKLLATAATFGPATTGGAVARRCCTYCA